MTVSVLIFGLFMYRGPELQDSSWVLPSSQPKFIQQVFISAYRVPFLLPSVTFSLLL